MELMVDLFTKYPQLGDPEAVDDYDFEGCKTRRDSNSPYDTLDVAMALVKSQGNIAAAARLLGRSRRSLHGHILRDIHLSDLLEDVEAIFLDELESLHRHTATFDKDARQFFLRTKGRNRGYVTRNEATGNNGGPIEVSTIDTSQLSTDALRELQKAMKNADAE